MIFTKHGIEKDGENEDLGMSMSDDQRLMNDGLFSMNDRANETNGADMTIITETLDAIRNVSGFEIETASEKESEIAIGSEIARESETETRSEHVSERQTDEIEVGCGTARKRS